MFRRITALKVLVVPVLVVLAIAGSATLYWFLYVRGRSAYLSSRNLRVLETLSGYIERSLDGDVSTLDSFMKLPEERRSAESARTFVPLVGLLEKSTRYTSLPADQVTDLARFYLAEPLSGTDWTITRRKPLDKSGLAFRVRLERVLEPILRDQLTSDVFDDVVVATTDGRVLFQRQPASLRIQSLATVQIDSGDGAAARKFADLSNATAVGFTTIAGNRYQLFIQPCCGSIRAMDKSSRGWVLVGLTPAARNSYRSLALSFTLLAPLIMLMTATFLGWPFLKIVLVGKHDSVRVFDVATAVASGLAAIALLTIALLDLYAVRGLGRRLDEQLERLASQLQQNLDGEIRQAATQLRQLEIQTTSPKVKASFGIGPRQEPVAVDEYVHILSHAPERAAYPLFETFAVADSTGRQAMKWTSGAFLTPLVDVNEREYFTHWKRHGDTNNHDEVFVQSIRSVTTGRKQAVLSKPVGPEFVAAARGDDPKAPVPFVSTLTLPMASLVDSIVAAGFGYAVIDADGVVLFHSDPRHNLEEQFFLETDQNRALRAAVAARQADNVDFTYWGGEYRGRVTPISATNVAADDSGFLPWTLVTFYDKSVFRGVHLEWLLTALILVLLYLTTCLGLAVATGVVRRGCIAAWVWPDRRNHGTYRRLAVAVVAWILAAGVAVARIAGPSPLVIAAMLPIFGWTLSYVLLSRGDPSTIRTRVAATGGAMVLLFVQAAALREENTSWTVAVAALLFAGAGVAVWTSHGSRDARREQASWPSVMHPFSAWVVLMLALTAMMPAVAAFKVAGTIQVDAFVKSRQLRLAREIEAHEMRIDKTAREARVADAKPFHEAAAVGDYTSAFLETAASEPAADRCRLTAGAEEYDDSRATLMHAFERLLPYFSESSVELRKLIVDGTSGDHAWDWHRPCPGRLVLHVSRRSEAHPIRLDSNVALMTQWPASARLEQGVLLALAIVVPFVLALGVAHFIMRRVFMIDLKLPHWLALPTGGSGLVPALNVESSRSEAAVLPFLWHGAAEKRRWIVRRALAADAMNPRVADTWIALAPQEGWSDAIDAPGFDWESAVDEATRRAAPGYQLVWNECSDGQKVVLDHLATRGVVNEKGRRELTELIAKGLIRRAPNFVLATETLRRFVLSQECHREVTQFEADREVSLWDRIRGPFLFAIAVATGFFVFTQQEVLSEAVRVAVTVVGALPTVLNLLGSVGNKGSAPKAA